MEIQNDFWNQVDKALTLHREHILTNEQRRLIADEEQKAYEANLETIKKIIEEYQENLKLRNFWTELQLDSKGFRFRFNTQGYYGPGGFSSQFFMS